MYEGEHGEVRGKPKMLYSARDWGQGRIQEFNLEWAPFDLKH